MRVWRSVAAIGPAGCLQRNPVAVEKNVLQAHPEKAVPCLPADVCQIDDRLRRTAGDAGLISHMLVKEGNCRSHSLRQVGARKAQHPDIAQTVVIRIIIVERVAHNAEQRNFRRCQARAARTVEPPKNSEQLGAAIKRQPLDSQLHLGVGRCPRFGAIQSAWRVIRFALAFFRGNCRGVGNRRRFGGWPYEQLLRRLSERGSTARQQQKQCDRKTTRHLSNLRNSSCGAFFLRTGKNVAVGAMFRHFQVTLLEH